MTLLYYLRSSNGSGNTGASSDIPNAKPEITFDWDAEALRRKKLREQKQGSEKSRRDEEDLLLMLGEFDA